MARSPPARHIGEQWNLGMLATPPVPCPECGKVSRAKEICPWCDTQWSRGELKQREISRKNIISSYNKNIREKLKRSGYL
jgi:ribosomal protein L32